MCGLEPVVSSNWILLEPIKIRFSCRGFSSHTSGNPSPTYHLSNCSSVTNMATHNQVLVTVRSCIQLAVVSVVLLNRRSYQVSKNNFTRFNFLAPRWKTYQSYLNRLYITLYLILKAVLYLHLDTLWVWYMKRKCGQKYTGMLRVWEPRVSMATLSPKHKQSVGFSLGEKRVKGRVQRKCFPKCWRLWPEGPGSCCMWERSPNHRGIYWNDPWLAAVSCPGWCARLGWLHPLSSPKHL